MLLACDNLLVLAVCERTWRHGASEGRSGAHERGVGMGQELDGEAGEGQGWAGKIRHKGGEPVRSKRCSQTALIARLHNYFTRLLLRPPRPLELTPVSFPPLQLSPPPKTQLNKTQTNSRMTRTMSSEAAASEVAGQLGNKTALRLVAASEVDGGEDGAAGEDAEGPVRKKFSSKK